MTTGCLPGRCATCADAFCASPPPEHDESADCAASCVVEFTIACSGIDSTLGATCAESVGS